RAQRARRSRHPQRGGGPGARDRGFRTRPGGCRLTEGSVVLWRIKTVGRKSASAFRHKPRSVSARSCPVQEIRILLSGLWTPKKSAECAPLFHPTPLSYGF